MVIAVLDYFLDCSSNFPKSPLIAWQHEDYKTKKSLLLAKK